MLLNMMTRPRMQHENRHKVGYARVSTSEQTLRMQLDALVAAGVVEEDIHTDVASGATMSRPGLKAALLDLRADDVLVLRARCEQ
jgi:DNA invertase Pin-like site-specific DNA recombinase